MFGTVFVAPGSSQPSEAHDEARRLRDEAGWTVAEIAKELHTSQSTIYRWFRPSDDLEAMERYRQACRLVASQRGITLNRALEQIREHAAAYEKPVKLVVGEILDGRLQF